ncbi:MAG: M24 family metallopeptidase [Anaerolineales bacterium]
MLPNQEMQLKLARIYALLDRLQVDGLFLRRVSSFAWATCGADSYVNTAATDGAASLLITREHRYLLTNNIEAPRMEQEFGLAEQGWEFRVFLWTEAQKELNRLTAGMRLATDGPLPGAKEASGAVAGLRSSLTEWEAERFRQLGKSCAEAMESALQAIQPGMSEHQIAAVLAQETLTRGALPIVNLVATDERVHNFRHPLPTEKKLEKYAMLVLCGRKWGLVCSITRLIHFGRVPADLQARILATAQVNAALIEATRPGRSLGELFELEQQAYERVGYPDEWQKHHQGGMTGYEPREFLALPGAQEVVAVGQAFAWNPSITGAKVEDTLLVGAEENQIITLTPTLPATTIHGIPCALAWEIT